MKNLKKIYTELIVYSALFLFAGCSMMSTTSVNNTNVELKTHYYSSNYNNVFDAAMQIVKEKWKIKEYDKELGIILAYDLTEWKSYKMQIRVSEEQSNKIAVDIKILSEGNFIQMNNTLIASFYKHLDERLH